MYPIYKDQDDIYTIENIQNSGKIIVENVQKIEYNIIFNGQGINIYDENGNKIDNIYRLYYGESFIFRIENKDSYQGTASLSVLGQTLSKDQNGLYIISNVISDKEIIINGLTPKNHVISYLY